MHHPCQQSSKTWQMFFLFALVILYVWWVWDVILTLGMKVLFVLLHTHSIIQILSTLSCFFFFSQSLFPQHIYFFKRNIYLVWANLLHSGVSKARLATKLLLSLSSLPWSRHLGQLLIQLCFLLFPLLNMFSSLPSEWKLWLFLCILALSFTSLLLQLFSEY